MSVKMNLGEFKIPENGIIEKIEKVLLAVYLGNSERIKKFADGIKTFPKNATTQELKMEYVKQKLGENVLVFTIKYFSEVTGERKEVSFTKFLNIPVTESGYQKSNLRNIKNINNLPDNLQDWIGKNVRLTTDKNGYIDMLK